MLSNQNARFVVPDAERSTNRPVAAASSRLIPATMTYRRSPEHAKPATLYSGIPQSAVSLSVGDSIGGQWKT